MRATFAILQREQAIVQDVELTTKFFSLLRHLSRSTEFLWIFNAELLKVIHACIFFPRDLLLGNLCKANILSVLSFRQGINITVYLL